jgi:hypothetical protein
MVGRVTLISVRGIGRSFGWNGPHTPQHCSGTSSETFGSLKFARLLRRVGLVFEGGAISAVCAGPAAASFGLLRPTRAARSEQTTKANATTRAVIAEIQRAGKTTLVAIARELEARGVHTPAGRDRWSPMQVSRLLGA